MSFAKLTFQGRGETIKILDTGKSIVNYLASQKSECPLIGSEIELVEKLGKGNFGAVFLVKIKGMGPKKYAAKKTTHDLYKFEYGAYDHVEKSLEDIATDMSDDEGISKEIFILINGGDPKRIVKPGEFLFNTTFAKICLTDKVKTYKRFDGQGETIVPIGSYLCEQISYSEYVIGLLCGDLYRSGISANFFDIFGFTTCPDTKNETVDQYVFMDKIDGSIRSIKDCVFEVWASHSEKYPEKFPEIIPTVLFIQVLHAIAVYQEIYQISHNDLHDDNIFIELIKKDTVYNSQNLYEADWFHYKLGKVDLYLPWIPLIVKIGDFGLSVKYSTPIVGDLEVFKDGYDQNDGKGKWIPNWFSPSYDMLYMSQIFQGNNFDNEFIKKVFMKILGVDKEDMIDKRKFFSYNAYMRPDMRFISQRDKEVSPAKILSDENLLGEFMVRPTEGKIVTLGKI